MTLRDISHGPEWGLWLVFGIFVVLSIVLLSGHGSGLIAGYNTSSEAEKNKYDEKKLCRVFGVGMSLITVFLFVMAFWQDTLPSYFIYIFVAFTLIDCTVIIVLANTICKKRSD